MVRMLVVLATHILIAWIIACVIIIIASVVAYVTIVC